MLLCLVWFCVSNSNYAHSPQSHIDSVIGASYALQSSKSGNSLASGQGSMNNSGGGHHRTSSISSNNSYGHHRASKRNSSNSISISGSPNEHNSHYGSVPKRSKLIVRDNSHAEAFKYTADLAEYAFFDKVRLIDCCCWFVYISNEFCIGFNSPSCICSRLLP